MLVTSAWYPEHAPLFPVCAQDEAFLSQLDPVVEQLSVSVPDAKYDHKSLAHLIFQLRQFMEDVMGKEVCRSLFSGWPFGILTMHIRKEVKASVDGR
jgi:hypothetical protein